MAYGCNAVASPKAKKQSICGYEGYSKRDRSRLMEGVLGVPCNT